MALSPDDPLFSPPGFVTVPAGTPGVTSQSPDGTINLAPIDVGAIGVPVSTGYNWKFYALLAALAAGAWFLMRKK